MNANAAYRVVQFRDPRPPQEILFALERMLTVLFAPVAGELPARWVAAHPWGSMTFRFTFTFESALERENAYGFALESVWPGTVADAEGARRSAEAWFDLWTRDFAAAEAAAPGDSARYQALLAGAMAAEAHLTDVGALQREIVARMRRGETFATSHKEGGTTLRYDGASFVRADYGESNATERFPDEAAFLRFLRQFYDAETSRHTAPEKVPDLVAWKLMLRLLRPAEKARTARAFWSLFR